MHSPRGAIVRRMRLSVQEGDATRTLTGAGIIVRPRPNAESRRTFLRHCARHGIVATVVETASHADGTFNRRTGVVQRASEPVPTAYQCVGDGPALRTLIGHTSVECWEYAVGVRLPVVSGGNGSPTQRSDRAAAYLRMSPADKRAVDERERRRTLTADQRTAIAIAEAAELPQ